MRKRRKKKKISPERKRRAKMISIGFFIILLFVALLIRIGYLKVKYSGVYEKRAMRQQISGSNDIVGAVNPNRGSILDRNKQTIASSIVVYNIFLDIRKLVTRKLEEQTACIESLSQMLAIPLDQLKDLIRTDAEGRAVNDTSYYILAKGIARKLAMEIQELKLPNVWLEEDSKRVYLHKNLAAGVIGFLRGDTLWGLESKYNEYLVGEPGRVFRTFDGENNVITQQIPAKDGYSLITNLDIVIQQIAEEAVLTAGKEYTPRSSSVIVMNPYTGEIYAMAQYPSVDINVPSDINSLTDENMRLELAGLSQTEQLDKLYRVWQNYNITATFEPGSIFKPVVVAAALEEGILKPEDTFTCNGAIYVSGQRIGCHYEPGHGTQNVTQVLANSCNPAMVEIAQRLGRDLFYKYRTDFGFAERTDIDLPAEESVSSPSVMYTLSQLNISELSTSGFGQGFSNTAIQAINAFSAVINGGNLMKPYIVSQVVDRNDSLVKEFLPTVQKKVISQETSNFMRKALQSVVTPTGTGKRAQIEGYNIGGKTGTAQQGDRSLKEEVLTFIAYLPVEDPEIIAMALIDRPAFATEGGSASAAPMLKAVLQKIINYKAIKPSSGDSTENLDLESNSFVLKDYKGLKVGETIKSLNSYKLDFKIIGNGNVVTSTTPQAGAGVSPGTTIYLTVIDDDEGELVPVPNVIGLTAIEATEFLLQAGFVPVVDDKSPVSENDEAKPEGEVVEKRVYEQMPGPDIKLRKGIEIKLKVK